jgi:hypothetical protein
MTIRPLPVALLATLILPVTSPAPITLKYKFTQSFAQTIDLSAVGQEVQSQQVTYDAYVAVTSHDSAGGHVVRAKVDSLVPAADADPQITAVLTGALKNAVDSGFVDAQGEVSGFAAGPAGPGLKGMMQAIYPKMKKGAKPGDVWTDTTSVTDSSAGGALTRKLITSYTATAGDKWKGEATLKLVTATSMAISGSQGGAQLEGNGRSSSTLTVSRAGHTVTAVSSGDINLTANTPQAPAPLPIVKKTSSTLTLLP